jgi:tetratricopeptide (TPR) repeat protein
LPVFLILAVAIGLVVSFVRGFDTPAHISAGIAALLLAAGSVIAYRLGASSAREQAASTTAAVLDARRSFATACAAVDSRHVSQRQRLQDEYDAPEGKAAALWFRGWAQAHLGDPRAGHRLIREGYEQAAGCGMRAFAGETLGYAAEALVLAGDWTAARQQIVDAMQSAEAAGDRNCLPRLLMLEARVADALGERRQARDSLHKAVAEARTQHAAWLELLARLALCERGDATVVELAALGEVVNGLMEGLDTAPAARARALVSRRARALA